MNRNPEQSAATQFSSKLPSAFGLSAEVTLKSAMLDLWKGESLGLFEDVLNGLFLIYNLRTEWVEVTESHATQYYPVLKRLVKLAEGLRAAMASFEPLDATSVEERARFFDTTVRPLCREFADILRESRGFLPAMTEEAARGTLRGRYVRHQESDKDLESQLSEVGENRLDDLIQMERRVGTLGLLRETEATQLDIAHLGQILEKMMPATTFHSPQGLPKSVLAQTPAHLAEASVLAIGRDMLKVSNELRQMLQHRLKRYTVFDIGTEELDENPRDFRDVHLMVTGDLLSVACSSTGCFSFGIPVSEGDFVSLEWLKEQVSRLIETYQPFEDELRATVSSQVADHLGGEGQEIKEYRLTIQFTLSPNEVSIPARLSSFDEQKVLDADDVWVERAACSLKNRTPGGRAYHTIAREPLLENEEFSCDKSVLPAIESIIDTLGTVETVKVEITSSDAISSAEDDELDMEPEFDVEESDPDELLVDYTDVESGPEKGNLYTFCNDRIAIEQTKLLRKTSIEGSFKQLQAVASLGLKAAGAVLDRPLHLPPYTNLVLTESFLQDRQLMSLFMEFASCCTIGHFEVLVDSVRARAYLNAALRVVRDSVESSQFSERLTVQFKASVLAETGLGLFESSLASLQIVSPSGVVLAEGTYSSNGGEFEMTTVPRSVVEPLKTAMAGALREQFGNGGILRLVPLAGELERRGFRIPDKLLMALFIHFKSLDGRDVGGELEDRVEAFLQDGLQRIPTRVPVYQGDMCEILSDEELPPSLRS
jgi:hypothetical protein